MAAIAVTAALVLPGLILSNLPWNTYTSTLGYEMAVPDNWILGKDKDRDTWTWAAVSGFGDAQLVVARGPSQGDSVKHFTESQARQLATSQGLQFDSLATTTLDGASAQLVSMHDGSAKPLLMWYLVSVRGDTIWALVWRDDPVREATDKTSFERMRASFRVLDQPGSISSPGPT